MKKMIRSILAFSLVCFMVLAAGCGSSAAASDKIAGTYNLYSMRDVGTEESELTAYLAEEQNITGVLELNEDNLAIFRRRYIGLVYQFYNLVPVLTAQENILLPHLLDGRAADHERLNQMISYLGLEDRRNHYPSQLSGGQQQRVSIGRALFTHPSILLCDEPTGNLDRKNSEEIIKLLRDSNRRMKQTVLLITHDESIAVQADRMIAIEDGRIVKDEKIRHTGSWE